MPEFWKETIDVVNSLLLGMPYHGLLLNERYLHHFFSHRIQVIHPKLMDLLDPAIPMRFHPEWPTYKEATGIDCGKYQEVNCRYLPVESGKKGGFIDFAFGPYLSPEIAVEFKLVFGWQGEAITFDYMKLLDGRNPFKSVVQVTVLMRPNGPAQGREKGRTPQSDEHGVPGGCRTVEEQRVKQPCHRAPPSLCGYRAWSERTSSLVSRRRRQRLRSDDRSATCAGIVGRHEVGPDH